MKILLRSILRLTKINCQSIKIFFLIVFLFCNFQEYTHAAQPNFYFTLFLNKEIDFIKNLTNENIYIANYLDKFRFDVLQNITNDTNIIFKLISDYEIFKYNCINNQNDKNKILNLYYAFKIKFLNLFLKNDENNEYLKLLISANFKDFSKLQLRKDYSICKIKLEELTKLIKAFKNIKDLKKIKEPRVQFLNDYLFYLNDKLLAAFLDKDTKTFNTTLFEIQTIYEYIINRINLNL